jgi:hypothetical protein
MPSSENKTRQASSKRKRSQSDEREHQVEHELLRPASEPQEEVVFIEVPHDGYCHQPSTAKPLRSALKTSFLDVSLDPVIDLSQLVLNDENMGRLTSRLELIEIIERALELVELAEDDEDMTERMGQDSSSWKFSLRHDPPFL